MRRRFRPLFALALVFALSGAGRGADHSPTHGSAAIRGPAQEPPRLVVLLVVDQLPAYLLTRLDPAFTGGFRRLADHGFSYDHATHDHSITETSPGHATISTGTEPAKHGVPANDWWETVDGQPRLVLNVADDEATLLDDHGLPGASPRVLRRDGLADWMQDADGDSRIVSISGKDRGAVLLAAHSDAHVYWFDALLGRFVTSRHYRRSYPDWVDDFNDDVVPTLVGDSVWHLDVPGPLRRFAREDDFPREGDGVHLTFPHTFAEHPSGPIAPSVWEWWATTPALDAATLRLAEIALGEEDLGSDEVPDLLAVSLSATDLIGHGYGPGSLEQLDNLMRLDRELGVFLDNLDRRFGPDGYLLAFTSDHGAMELAEVRAAKGLPGVRLTPDSVAALQAVVDAVNESAQGAEALARGLAEGVPGVSWIEEAWIQKDIESRPAQPDSFTVFQMNSHVKGRPSGILSRAGIEMRFSEGVITWAYPLGTGHGSPYLYDRHVPLIFLGAGVEHGRSAERVSIADLAPTLAAMLGIAIPDDLDGVARTPR